MPRPARLSALAMALLCAVAISALPAPPALASEDAAGDAATSARPAGWHARDRVFAGAPVTRTTEEIREMRSQARARPASDPATSCYYTEHIVNRCPQAGRPWLF